MQYKFYQVILCVLGVVIVVCMKAREEEGESPQPGQRAQPGDLHHIETTTYDIESPFSRLIHFF